MSSVKALPPRKIRSRLSSTVYRKGCSAAIGVKQVPVPYRCRPRPEPRTIDRSTTDKGYDSAVHQSEYTFTPQGWRSSVLELADARKRRPGPGSKPIDYDECDWTPQKYRSMNERFCRQLNKCIARGLERAQCDSISAKNSVGEQNTKLSKSTGSLYGDAIAICVT